MVEVVSHQPITTEDRDQSQTSPGFVVDKMTMCQAFLWVRTQPPVQWILELFPLGKVQGVRLQPLTPSGGEAKERVEQRGWVKWKP